MTAPKAQAVERTFAGIAPRYDLANHLLSFGLDFLWRRRLVRMATASQSTRVLDLATGSGDVAFALRAGLPAETAIIGLDFCQPMLDQAIRKAMSRGSPSNLEFLRGDCLDLPFDEESFDVVTIAFGLRNLEDRARGLSEMLRVLRPNGRLLVLEFSQPYRWLRPMYCLYLKAILPIFAWLLTRDRKAYEYLGSSITGFPDRGSLSAELQAAGFTKVSSIAMTGSVVAIHSGGRGEAD
ncbi:MAG: bifunctional demethylmenaquinone methyltransferase/2-methoxy-6-polyprenyl-1,4-benzoquinol methylase UbiE [Opitutales bacterium]